MRLSWVPGGFQKPLWAGPQVLWRPGRTPGAGLAQIRVLVSGCRGSGRDGGCLRPEGRGEHWVRLVTQHTRIALSTSVGSPKQTMMVRHGGQLRAGLGWSLWLMPHHQALPARAALDQEPHSTCLSLRALLGAMLRGSQAELPSLTGQPVGSVYTGRPPQSTNSSALVQHSDPAVRRHGEMWAEECGEPQNWAPEFQNENL